MLFTRTLDELPDYLKNGTDDGATLRALKQDTSDRFARADMNFLDSDASSSDEDSDDDADF